MSSVSPDHPTRGANTEAAPRHSESMEYRREIDGLRALAVLPVILFHAGFKAFSGGFVGVDIFFVISGFLITSIILGDAAAGRFSLLDFYDRRARRILPALYLVLLVCIPFAWIVLPPIELTSFSKSLVSIPLFSSNFFFWRDGNYFETTAELKPLLHTWSLAVEEQYYLFFPIFLTVILRAGLRWIFLLLSTVAASSLVLAQVLSSHSPVANFFLLPTRAWELAIGALVACHLRRSSSERIPVAARQVLSAAGLGLIVASILLFTKTTPFPGFAALAPTLGAALILLCARPDTLVGQALAIRAAVGIGLVSYSAYLWHQPLLALVRYRFPSPGSVVMGGLVGCTFALAWMTWKYVERPFRIRSAFDRRSVFRWSAVASAFLVLFGAASARLFRTTSVCGVESRIAKTLVGSRAVYASGLDERELVRYRIQYQPHNPAVVVLGSSRIMQVGEHNLTPGTLNLAVSGSSVEDLVAIGGLVAKRFKPATILIGVDPWLFNARSGQDRWKTLRTEYLEQLSLLSGQDGTPNPATGEPPERTNLLDRLGGRLYRSINRKRCLNPR